MIVKSLELRNYRNYEYSKIKLDKGVHLIVGKNAQGKTNLLESLYYLSTMRSHRNVSEKFMIKKGEDYFFIKVILHKNENEILLKCITNEKGKNLFYFDNKIDKVSEFIGHINTVLFCPNDMNLFQSSPKLRRKFIDIELSKISKYYMRLLSEINELRKQRNSLLKKNNIDKHFLNILSNQLIEREVLIIQQRNHFIKDITKLSNPFYNKLSNDGTILDFQYKSIIPYNDDIDVLKSTLKDKYKDNLEKDMVLKQSTVGIHKEDFQCYLNGYDLESFASQGQKRSVILAMKIALTFLIKRVTNDTPILLLDDVFSELDELRRIKLLEVLPNESQIFITTTDVQEIPKFSNRNYFIWNVVDGQIQSYKED